MILIDFEKAFDTLEGQFLHNTLKYLNFGPNLRNWISVMYSDVESGIINFIIVAVNSCRQLN